MPIARRHGSRPRFTLLASAMSLALLPSLALAQAAAPVPAEEEKAPDTATLATVEVRSQLESQLRALDLQRDSDAIIGVVSSDSLGVYPDKNVAESLQRLPGVSITRDQGEGRFVVVRGLDAALNSVSVNGMPIGTPEDSSRQATLDVIPSDSTERLTVVKAPTPDMSGDAIGGSIEIESASAFDRDGRSLRGKIALIDRGTCSFTTKAQYAMRSGAVGMIVVNDDPLADPIPMGNADVPQLPINLPLPLTTKVSCCSSSLSCTTKSSSRRSTVETR